MAQTKHHKLVFYSLIKPLVVMGLLLWLGQTLGKTNHQEQSRIPTHEGMTREDVLHISKQTIMASHFRHEDLKRVAELVPQSRKISYFHSLSKADYLIGKCIEMHVQLKKSQNPTWVPLWEELRKTLTNLADLQFKMTDNVLKKGERTI